jgi:penicillin-binding protein 2B
MIRTVRIRTLLIGGCFILFFVALIIRLYWIQVVHGEFWASEAEKRWSVSKTLDPHRGTIVDRNGNVLAENAPAYTLAANPQTIADLGIAELIASRLSEVLNKPEQEIMNALTAKREDGTYLVYREIRNEGWKMDADLSEKVAETIEAIKSDVGAAQGKVVKDVGLMLIKEEKRYYPKNRLASHLLGYMSKEGKAVTGLEYYFDEQLSGTRGTIAYQKDRKGYKLPDAKVEYVPPVDGEKLILTLDEKIQSYIEEAMKKAYETYKPKSMTVIAADPNTMEILGLANLPDYNPNTYWSTGNQAAFYNHAIQSMYEPGSTFKIVTLAAAVEEGLFQPNDYYKSGSIKVGGRTIHDIRREGWGEISYLEGLKRSSNVAFVKLGYEKLGKQKLEEYINAFGFSQKTGIELPGESSGMINLKWDADYAAATYGHGQVLVTPIQQITAVAAVANGGKLLKPRMIKAFSNPATGETVETKPLVIRQVISEETSRKVGEYLEQVVSDQKIGTGRNAYIEGYRIAGKTGTASKVVNGEYDSSQSLVSFIGYGPVEDPKIIIYVVVDTPNDEMSGGGTVAAPIFKEIMEKSLRYLGVASANSTELPVDERLVAVPDITGMTVVEAQQKLKEQSLAYELIGNGSKVVRQSPMPGSKISPEQSIYLFSQSPDEAVIPDMKGMSLRDALEICSLIGIDCRAEGEGYVESQKIVQENGVQVLRLKLLPMSESKQTSEPPAEPENQAEDDAKSAAGDDPPDGGEH